MDMDVWRKLWIIIIACCLSKVNMVMTLSSNTHKLQIIFQIHIFGCRCQYQMEYFVNIRTLDCFMSFCMININGLFVKFWIIYILICKLCWVELSLARSIASETILVVIVYVVLAWVPFLFSCHDISIQSLPLMKWLNYLHMQLTNPLSRVHVWGPYVKTKLVCEPQEIASLLEGEP